MPTFMQVLTGAGATAGVSTAAYWGISNWQREETFSIRELLAQNRSRVLISSGEESRWEKIWTEYKSKNTNKIKDSWSLEGWDHTKTQTRLPSLEVKCSTEISREVKSIEDKEYRDFVTYCTREAEFQDRLAWEGYKVIPDSGSEQTWTDNFNEYKKATNQLKIHNLTIGTNEEYSQHASKLKDGCKTALSKPISDEEYSQSFEAIKRWCATK
ncbi:hypothetical protein HF1_08250 [Mycoplasma haemofelis str. Langford 1]|uniref:Uncharacterized protein n=2 Tax=Mycoplasma haemofelis TaxID=29501 RepID=F6FIW4_MYCHI|nr:hypothetical protein [Mycoplasma haemofelis]AEG73162.1 hypothetical protein MHF_0904 [Mycoplasma haemofelis Ohio2]CBY92833.1 hypothetical protein HF1_08250 [Mycoplasma haemofelis str. Langford 1]